jgi:BirA family biotin operon repressor/biotin-[acetyl-CoA-carboxylase] ligase
MAYQPILAPPLHLIELQTVGSTNDHAKQLAKNAYPAGTVVWAQTQTAGRGRQGNIWESFSGNLFMSMILRPKMNISKVGQLSFLTAVAVVTVLKKHIPAPNALQLKWPNDVLLNGKKIAGILIESESRGVHHLPWAVVGIGVNVTGAPENGIALRDIGVSDVESGHLVEGIAREMKRLLKQWEKDGFSAIREIWLGHAYKLGEDITARLPQETVTGIFSGIDATGALQLKMNDETMRLISSGEVFL